MLDSSQCNITISCIYEIFLEEHGVCGSIKLGKKYEKLETVIQVDWGAEFEIMTPSTVLNFPIDLNPFKWNRLPHDAYSYIHYYLYRAWALISLSRHELFCATEIIQGIHNQISGRQNQSAHGSTRVRRWEQTHLYHNTHGAIVPKCQSACASRLPHKGAKSKSSRLMANEIHVTATTGKSVHGSPDSLYLRKLNQNQRTLCSRPTTTLAAML